MAQVPYNPVPQGTITDNPTPGLQLNVPAGAFGVDVAKATQHMGAVQAQAGAEIFDTAVKFQKMANEAEAKQADADYIIKAGQLHADYQSLSGLEAVKAYPKFVENLKTLREESAAKLSTMESAKLFDGASLGTMSRTIFAGASHSATENKKAALGASTARVDAAGNQALTQPQDEEMFKQSLGVTQAEVRSQGNLLGWDSDKTDYELKQKTSELWEKRIQGLSKTQPFSAKKMLDKATADGNLSGEANGRVTDYVNKQLYTVGARNISADINAGGTTAFGEKVVPISQAKAAIGGFESSNNYQAKGRVLANGDQALGKYQIMSSNLPTWLKEAGRESMTPEQFLHDPDAQDAVFETKFGQFMTETGTFNDAASKWFSGKTRAEAGNVRDANGTTVPHYITATNAILAQKSSLASRVEVGRTAAGKIAPEDKLFPDYVQERITSDYNKATTIKRDDEWRNRQTIESALVSGNKNGDVPTTVEELKSVSPEVEAAYTSANYSTQRSYMKVLATNAKGDTAWTDEKLKEYQRLRGLAANDPVEFLNMDPVQMDLPMSARKELIGLQGKIQKDSEGDPRLKRAIQILQPTLNAAGIDRRRDKDSYDQFSGSLMDQLRMYREENKKEAPPEEVQKMGARLLQLQAGSGYFGTNVGRTPLYQVPAPNSLVEKVQEEATKKGVPPPTADQIQREYTRQMYQTLYGKPAKPASAAGPQVPRAQ